MCAQGTAVSYSIAKSGPAATSLACLGTSQAPSAGGGVVKRFGAWPETNVTLIRGTQEHVQGRSECTADASWPSCLKEQVRCLQPS